MVLSHRLLPFLLLLLFPTPIPCTLVSQGPSSAVAAAGPILEDRPFVVVWNMPTAQCQRRHGVHLDLGDFDIVENRQQRFQGQVTGGQGQFMCIPDVSQLCLFQLYLTLAKDFSRYLQYRSEIQLYRWFKYIYKIASYEAVFIHVWLISLRRPPTTTGLIHTLICFLLMNVFWRMCYQIIARQQTWSIIWMLTVGVPENQKAKRG